MRVYLNDKVIAKPITLYIHKLPVFMLPFYIFPIERGRHSGFLVPQFEFGFDQTRGRFVRNAGYYWAMNDYADVTGWADYYDVGPRIVGSLTGRYALRYRLSGDAFVSYSRDQATERRELDLRGNHSQTLAPGFTLTMHGDYVSDASFRKDTESRSNRNDRLDQILRSNATIARSWSGASLSATASRTENHGADRGDLVNENLLQESLPQISFVLTQRPVGRAKSVTSGEEGFLPALATLRYGYSADLRSDRREDETSLVVRDTAGVAADTVFGTTSDRSSRLFHTVTLNDSRSLAFVNVIPALTVRESWVDRTFSATDTVKGFARAATWSFATSANTNLYGTFAPSLGRLVGIRHTVTPSVSFNYQPEFRSLTYSTLRPDSSRVRLPRYPGISASENRFLSMTLENRFQAKVKDGEEIRRIDNLLSWRLSSSYDFLARKRNLAHSLANIQSSVDTRVTERVSFDFDSEHDPRKRFRFERANFRTGTSFRGDLSGAPAPARGDTIDMGAPAAGGGERLPWSLSLGFSYAGGRVGRSTWDSSIRTDLNSEAALTKNWRASYSATVDLSKRQLLYQRVSVHRDLHCWEASFDRTFSGNASEYYFRINIKDLPDVRYERGRGQSPLEGLRTLGNLPY
jgi:hypothetical protein